jgi:O-acetyl-ADP-ribose deacetylase (regulator of RNase III)
VTQSAKRSIVHTGGEVIQKESNKLLACLPAGRCDIGKAVVTGAGKLPAKCIIQVPTTDYVSGKKANLSDIRSGVLAALEIAKNTGCKSAAFPLLGTGVVGLPIVGVAKAMKETADSVPEIESTLVAHSQQDYDSIKDLFLES